MRLSDKLALGGAIFMSVESVGFAIGPVFRLYAPEITGWELPLAIAGWVLASYSPILVAALFWRWADRFAKGWLLHLLLIPCVFVPVLAGERMMQATVSDVDFDDTLGAPIMPALLCLVAVVAIYFSALAVNCALKLSARSHSR